MTFARPLGVCAVALALAGALAACSGSTSGEPRLLPPSVAASSAPSSAASSAASSGGLPQGWVEETVSFSSDGLRTYATYRHPASAARGPAALLIAGSGIPDRNGDSPGEPEGSLRLLANQLALDGVATLRYDKLGSGQTGLGPYAVDPAAVRVAAYSHEAATALQYLAGRPRTDPSAISVFGHSEGGFYALMLATGKAGPVPHIARLGLIEPLSRRSLDVIDEQTSAILQKAVRAGQLTSAAGQHDRQQITDAIGAVRAGKPPGAVPSFIASVFSARNVGYTADIDRYDPATLGAELPAGTRVLLTCSPTDMQVYCSDVQHLDAGLEQGAAAVDFVQVPAMDHALKPDTTPDSSNDTAPLPMAGGLSGAIARFMR